MEVGSSLISAFENMNGSTTNERQELRGGKYCSTKGVSPKQFYDTVAKVVHHIRSSDFVSNNSSLKDIVDAHISQSFNHVDKLLTPENTPTSPQVGVHGLLREFAATKKVKPVIVDITRRSPIKMTSRKEYEDETIPTSRIKLRSQHLGKNVRKPSLSLANIMSEEESYQSSSSEEDLHAGDEERPSCEYRDEWVF